MERICPETWCVIIDNEEEWFEKRTIEAKRIRALYPEEFTGDFAKDIVTEIMLMWWWNTEHPYPE